VHTKHILLYSIFACFVRVFLAQSRSKLPVSFDLFFCCFFWGDFFFFFEQLRSCFLTHFLVLAPCAFNLTQDSEKVTLASIFIVYGWITHILIELVLLCMSLVDFDCMQVQLSVVFCHCS
jgi:hypothetical protein